MTTSITLPFPVSLNNMFVNKSRGGRFPSQRYEDWKTEAGWLLKQQRPTPITGQVTLNYVFQDNKDKKKRDLDNLAKGVSDLLVDHGIIEADDNTIVRRISLSWGQVDGCQVHVIPHEAQS